MNCAFNEVTYTTQFDRKVVAKIVASYLHCSRAQNTPLFRPIVFSFELIVKKFPCAVHITAAPTPITAEPTYSDHTIGLINDNTKPLKKTFLFSNVKQHFVREITLENAIGAYK